MSTRAIKQNSDKTERFEQKRSAIIDAACTLINEKGVKGMTFVDVANLVGLNTTSVTYYFKRKEQLAAAALKLSIERIEAMVLKAGEQPTPQARVSAYLQFIFDRLARIRRDEERPIAVLSDIRAMEEPARSELVERYSGVFRHLRNFFEPATSDEERLYNNARTHVLIENVFWLPAWIVRYSISDFGRVQARLEEIILHGFARSDAQWNPAIFSLSHEGAEACADTGPETFLRAATRLINERGYRGASVERIASELKVTKGSFYHHLEGKDGLVLACFERGYARVSEAQYIANNADGDNWQKLCSTIGALLHIQFFGEFPLLRTTALQALPFELRTDVVNRSNRMARRFAGTVIDGITDGSICAVDPLIASQAIMATLNSAYELRSWASRWSPEQAIAIYAGILTHGLFNDGKRASALAARTV